jgi:sec-independent protein translocase protein TatA
MFADLMRPGALIILLLVVLVLFGAKRLPEASKALGQSLRIFKAETKGLREDDVEAKAQAKVVKAEPLPPSEQKNQTVDGTVTSTSEQQQREQQH